MSSVEHFKRTLLYRSRCRRGRRHLLYWCTAHSVFNLQGAEHALCFFNGFRAWVPSLKRTKKRFLPTWTESSVQQMSQANDPPPGAAGRALVKNAMIRRTIE